MFLLLNLIIDKIINKIIIIILYYNKNAFKFYTNFNFIQRCS